MLAASLLYYRIVWSALESGACLWSARKSANMVSANMVSANMVSANMVSILPIIVDLKRLRACSVRWLHCMPQGVGLSPRCYRVSVCEETFLLREPCQCDPAAETAIQPQIRCFQSWFSNLSPYPEERLFHRHPYCHTLTTVLQTLLTQSEWSGMDHW